MWSPGLTGLPKVPYTILPLEKQGKRRIQVSVYSLLPRAFFYTTLAKLVMGHHVPQLHPLAVSAHSFTPRTLNIPRLNLGGEIHLLHTLCVALIGWITVTTKLSERGWPLDLVPVHLLLVESVKIMPSTIISPIRERILAPLTDCPYWMDQAQSRPAVC